LPQDYVYHQIDEQGHPVLDLGHIVHSLNRLDSGDPEKILLMSRDAHTMIIVTFEDIKRCLEAAWVEFCELANTNPSIQELAHPLGPGHEHQMPPRLVPPHVLAQLGGGLGVGGGVVGGGGFDQQQQQAMMMMMMRGGGGGGGGRNPS